MSYPPAGQHVIWHGHTLDARTAYILGLVEQKLGFQLDCIQGCFNAGGVVASSGTHDGAGAVDVSPYVNGRQDADLIVRTLREFGFAAWHRLPTQGKWVEHIHAIESGNPGLSAGATQQVAEYTAGKNGLVTNGPDDGPRITLVPVHYPPLAIVSLPNVRKQALAGGTAPLPGVRQIQLGLIRNGYQVAVDGLFGAKTKAAYAAYEKKVGGDGDGIPGLYSLTKLGEGHFKVRKS